MGVVTSKFQLSGFTENWAMQNRQAIEKSLVAALELPATEKLLYKKIRKLTIMKGAIGGVTRQANSTRRILSENYEVKAFPRGLKFIEDLKCERELEESFPEMKREF